jgi:hypothetical protein
MGLSFDFSLAAAPLTCTWRAARRGDRWQPAELSF